MGETGKRPSSGENPLNPSGSSFHVFANKVGSSLKGTLNLATNVIRENKFEVIAFSLMYAFTRDSLHEIDARIEELGINLARLVLNIARQDRSLVSFSLPK